jgi:hypothetical protein
VNSLVVERTGLAQDAAFSGIVLLDENNLQIGLEKTLNSVHQVTLSEAFTVKAGQTKTMTIAANRGSTSAYAGQIGYLSLVSVNTSATVNGALPITGTGQTINETLSIGSVTTVRGPLDPGAGNTKEIGTTGYTFSSVKVTCGSNEKCRLLSMRWNQSGSASKDDLANIKTVVDGVSYDTIVSSDGKYYTSTFDSGIVIDKGFAKEISVKGDLVSGSARTVDFDVYKRTDIYIKGETYGYGILVPDGSAADATDDDGMTLIRQPLAKERSPLAKPLPLLPRTLPLTWQTRFWAAGKWMSKENQFPLPRQWSRWKLPRPLLEAGRRSEPTLIMFLFMTKTAMLLPDQWMPQAAPRRLL